MSTLVNLLALGVCIVLAAVPTLVYVLVLWFADRYEKEPLRLLIITFLWGAVPAAVLSFFTEGAFEGLTEGLSPGLSAFVGVTFVAPLVEETFKGLAVLGVFLLARNEFDGLLDGIIYGAIVGFGFAMSENVLYFMRAWTRSGFWGLSFSVFGRAIVFGLNHAMYTSFTGIGFGLARYTKSGPKGLLWVLGGLALAMMAHFAHNASAGFPYGCLLSVFLDWGGVFVVLVAIALAWRRERAWMTQELAEEVQAGVLSAEQYETIISRRNRYRQQWRALGEAGVWRTRLWGTLAHTATELAFKRHQQTVLGAAEHHGKAIAALRQKIVRLRQNLDDEAALASRTCATCGRPTTENAAECCAHCGGTLA
jgi:RsiW-degrading membrane proteinase PrsW (M82 family)